MGSLIDELQRLGAAARVEAEELRGRIAELAERLAGVEERLSRLVIARGTVDEVLGDAGVNVSPAAGPEVTGPPGPGHSPVIGVLAVPPRRAGPGASVLPQSYQDLLEVVADADRPLRAARCRRGGAAHGPGAVDGLRSQCAGRGRPGQALRCIRGLLRSCWRWRWPSLLPSAT